MRWLHRTATALGFLVILITVTPVLRWWTAALSSPWGPNTAEYLVIPGGEMFAPDTLGISSYWRSFYGALEWRTGHYGHIVVSGHDAANVAKLLGPNPGRIVLLTSDYHSARALRTFRQAGLNTTALPYPDANKRINLKTAVDLGGHPQALESIEVATAAHFTNLVTTAAPVTACGHKTWAEAESSTAVFRINVWKDRWTVFLILSDETVKTVWYRVYR